MMLLTEHDPYRGSSIMMLLREYDQVIHIVDHQNNVYIAFPMSENLGLDALIIIIPDIGENIQKFKSFTFR